MKYTDFSLVWSCRGLIQLSWELAPVQTKLELAHCSIVWNYLLQNILELF